MKRIIRLTESDLHRIIKEAARRIIKEDVLGNDWNTPAVGNNNNVTDVSNNYEPFDDQESEGGENDWSTVGDEQIDPTQYNPNDIGFKR